MLAQFFAWCLALTLRTVQQQIGPVSVSRDVWDIMTHVHSTRVAFQCGSTVTRGL